MKETKVVTQNELVCAGCGCSLEDTEFLYVFVYNTEDYVCICTDCVHTGHNGFVYCNCCGGPHEGCWVESNLLEKTVSVTDEGQNWICPMIIDTFKSGLTKCKKCGRWYRDCVNSIMNRLSSEDDVCYQCYSKEYQSEREN